MLPGYPRPAAPKRLRSFSARLSAQPPAGWVPELAGRRVDETVQPVGTVPPGGDYPAATVQSGGDYPAATVQSGGDYPAATGSAATARFQAL
jgi:hypothetical protein